MDKKRRALALALSGASTLPAWKKPLVNSITLPAHAATSPPHAATSPPIGPTSVRWTLSGVTLSLGGSISGSFVYTADTNTYSEISLMVSGAPTPAHNGSYVQVNPAGFNRSLLFALKAGSTPGNLVNDPQVSLDFISDLTDAGGNISVNNPPGTFTGNCSNADCTTISNTGLNVANAGSVIGTVI